MRLSLYLFPVSSDFLVLSSETPLEDQPRTYYYHTVSFLRFMAYYIESAPRHTLFTKPFTLYDLFILDIKTYWLYSRFSGSKNFKVDLTVSKGYLQIKEWMMNFLDPKTKKERTLNPLRTLVRIKGEHAVWIPMRTSVSKIPSCTDTTHTTKRYFPTRTSYFMSGKRSKKCVCTCVCGVHIFHRHPHRLKMTIKFLFFRMSTALLWLFD